MRICYYIGKFSLSPLYCSVKGWKLEMEEAQTGENLQRRKKKCKKKKKKVEEEGFATVSDSEGLEIHKKKKKRKHSCVSAEETQVRRSPYFQKIPEEKQQQKKNKKKPLISVPPEVGKSNEILLDKDKEKEPLLISVKPEEEEDQKKKPRTQLFVKIEEALSRYAYKHHCQTLRRKIGFCPLKKQPLWYNAEKKASPYFQKRNTENDERKNHDIATSNTMARPHHVQVPKVKVSPYFQRQKAGNVERKNHDTSTMAQVRKVSPYFQNQNSTTPAAATVQVHNQQQEEKEKDIAVKKKRSRSVTLTAAQKRDEAYERKRPDNTWNPPRSPIVLLQHEHVHDPWRVIIICMLLNRTTGLQVHHLIDMHSCEHTI